MLYTCKVADVRACDIWTGQSLLPGPLGSWGVATGSFSLVLELTSPSPWRSAVRCYF